MAVVAGTLVSAATAQAPAKASVAVISGDLGKVASKRVSGGGSTSGSIPAKLPDGVVLGDGFYSATTSSSDGTATAQAEADDLELFGGEVTASIVSRTATATAKGVKYRGSVRDLVLGDEEIGSVERDQDLHVRRRQGRRQPGRRGDDRDADRRPQRVPGGDEGRRGRRVGEAGAVRTRADHRDRDADGRADGSATPEPTATPKPRDTTPSWKKRLMSKRFVFPVGGKTTIGGPFGSFRADTGAHQGNDLFADFGTPVVAVADGTIKNVGSLPISGNRLWVYADGGDQFFYAHLASFAPAAVDERHVEAGTILGYIGNTGDAEPTPPHLHFEIHPNGGKAVDPNSFLVAWQKRAGAALTDSAERPGALVEVRDFIGEG